ncbi:MAG: glutamyl-tRNA reductase [Myxococcota bacterium]
MLVVGLSHRTAPIEVRERVAIAPHDVADALRHLGRMPEIEEAVVLSTCNRMEVYVAPRGEVSDAERAVTRFIGELGGRDVVPYLWAHHHERAITHLFRVASSLDSMVLGEPQILGQLKDAMRRAERTGTLGPALFPMMRSALSAAKRVRTETSVGTGQVSVPSVAVDLARQIFDAFSGHTALVVGAGVMAENAAKLLARAGADIAVINRSPERAQRLASDVGGRTEAWEHLTECLVGADIVVSSTASPSHVITKRQLQSIRRQRRGRSLFVIDIAVPRDVDPRVNDLENVYLYDIDDLSQVVAETLAGRKTEAERAERIVHREVQLFEERRRQQEMKPVVVALRERTRAVIASELSRSCRGRLKHLPADDREALARMVDAAVNKLMHRPTKRLKELAQTPRSHEVATLVAHLFDLELDEDPSADSLPPPPSENPADDDDEPQPDDHPHPRHPPQ